MLNRWIAHPPEQINFRKFGYRDDSYQCHIPRQLGTSGYLNVIRISSYFHAFLQMFCQSLFGQLSLTEGLSEEFKEELFLLDSIYFDVIKVNMYIL